MLAYIEAHRAEVEAEYRDMLQMATEIRQYWQERNRDRFAQLAAAPPRPGYDAVRVKLIERRRRREAKQR